MLAVEDLELERAELAAAWLVIELVEQGFTVDDALGLVEFPTWPGES
jgi:hypothetical protein